VPTLPQRGGEAVLSDALKLAEELIIEASRMHLQVRGIGVAVAELVDLEGNVTSDNCIAWRGVPIRAAFAKLAPAVVEADARAAALGESMFGNGRSFKVFFYVTVGTGIGSCLMLDGLPYTGARGSAGTLASSPLTTSCTECGAVLTPILEEIASGPALVKEYNRRFAKHATRAEEVMAVAAAGDRDALQIVRSAGEALGATVGLMVNVLDPEAVVVGGGVVAADGLYWDSFVNSTRNHVWSETNRHLPILRAAYGIDAGWVGAAAAFLKC
jgi:glucokinase